MKYGYARVSSTEQNLDRQLMQLREYIEDSRYIICDKQSGKNFDRKGYNLLVGTETTAPLLHEGDLLIVCSLDRLGRNYTEIRDQWKHITSALKADIKILDMPLLDTTSEKDNLDRRFIVDLVLQILSYTAEKERLNIRKRQQEGIEAAKAKGKHLGRPEINYPDNWLEVYTKWCKKEITATEAMKETGLKRNSFYKLANKYRK